MFRRNRKPPEKKINASLTGFAADLVIALGLPKTATMKSRSGLYLQISAPEKYGDIAEIALWRGIGDQQTPLINVSYRKEPQEKYLLSTSLKKPIQPLGALLAAVLAKGENHVFVTRDQALVAICTMMKYVETTS